MTATRQKRRRSCCALALGSLLSLFGCESPSIQTISSPNNQYCLVVRAYPMLFALPGQGSDAPGTITLYSASGEALSTSSLAMLQYLGNVEWQDNQVSIEIGLDTVIWPLPETIEMDASNACDQFEQA